MTRVLFADLVHCREHLHGDNAQFWRRAYARAVCAFIEGVTAPLKQQALVAALNDIPERIDIGRISVLIGETYAVNDHGEIQRRNFALPTFNGVALAFRYFAEAVSSPFRLDRSGSGWQALRQAFGIRDRIMHPKQLQHLDITNAELESFEEAARFIHNSIVELMTQAKLNDKPA